VQPEHRQSLLDRATQVLAGEPDGQIAIAFGSAVDARAGFESDFDVAVLRDRSLDTQRRFALIEQLAQATGRPIDLVDLESAGIPIQKWGQVQILRASGGAWAVSIRRRPIARQKSHLTPIRDPNKTPLMDLRRPRELGQTC